MTGLGIATNAFVGEGDVKRTREGDRVVLDTPVRRDFWFGHGFVLDAPPDAARLAALIENGRVHFAALGAARFIVQWERALDEPDTVPAAPGGTLRDRSVVMLHRGAVPEADARVADHDDETWWDEAAALAAAQFPQQADYERWRCTCLRRDVARGLARAVGIRAGRHLLNTAALYRGDGIARFATPVTRPDARGRGLFTACARTLIAWANADAPRRVVIAADPNGGPIALYDRLGFAAVSYLDAVIVPLPTDEGGGG